MSKVPAPVSFQKEYENVTQYVKPDFRQVKHIYQPDSGIGFSNIRNNLEELIDPMTKYNSNGFSLSQYETERHCNKLFEDKHADYKLIDEQKRPPDYVYLDIIKWFQERGPVMDVFFSQGNLDHLQSLIISMIYNLSNGLYQIGRQNDNILLETMKAVFIDTPVNGNATGYALKYEVCCLNKTVLDAVVPDVYSGILKYLGYVKDQGNNPWTMDRPQNMSIVGTQLTRGFDFNII